MKYELPLFGPSHESALKELLIDIGKEDHKVSGIVSKYIYVI